MKRFAALALAALILVSTAVAASADEWTQYGYDAAYSRVNPNQAPIDASRWRVRWSKATGISTNPIILEDRIIVGGRKFGADWNMRAQLWAYDYQGHKLWTRQVGIGMPSESIAYIDGMVAIGVSNIQDSESDLATPELEFVNAETGKKVVSIPGVLGGYAPVADARYLYQGINGAGVVVPNGLMRLDPATLEEVIVPVPGIDVTDQRLLKPPTIIGDEVWRASAPRNPDGDAPIVGNGVALVVEGSAKATSTETGAVTRSLTCAAMPGNQVCAIDIESGQTLWSFAESAITPTIVGDVAFVGCGPSYAVCRRDLRTGALLSETPDFTHGSEPRFWEHGWIVGMGAPAVGGGVYFVNGWDDSLHRWVTAGIDVETGQLLTRRRGLLGPTGTVHAAVANGLLVTTGLDTMKVVSFDRV